MDNFSTLSFNFSNLKNSQDTIGFNSVHPQIGDEHCGDKTARAARTMPQ